MRIGFFGGSFNPPTNAHISLAKTALEKCKLDKIIFIPMGDFYGKQGLAKAKYRYEMLEIVCKAVESFEVSDIEIKVNKKLDTIDAFRLIEKTYPNEEKYFLMGADNFIKLLEWKESESLSEYNYIVFEREKINLKQYIANNSILRNTNIEVIENKDYKEKSATEFRNLWRKEKANQDIIPKEVIEFIEANNIY